MKRILITGAAGIIGNALRQGLRGSYSLIRLADIASLGSTAAGEELATTDIRDMAALEKPWRELTASCTWPACLRRPRGTKCCR